MVKFCEEHGIIYYMKRIRKKWDGERYDPVYTEEQLRFLNDSTFRYAQLENVDEA